MYSEMKAGKNRDKNQCFDKVTINHGQKQLPKMGFQRFQQFDGLKGLISLWNINIVLGM